ncbi:MAG: ABC transporter permease [Verrucomicrobia bacterium]|nr:ABC transporter permease [Verrucomicrobiota bacterium]
MGVQSDNILWLGIKELRSLAADPVLLFLIAFAFTLSVYAVGTGARTEVVNAAVGVVDEDRSELSRRIASALLKPYFKPATQIRADQIDPAMDCGRLVFVIEVPPRFEFDVLAGRQPTIQIDVDATAMVQAGNGVIYVQKIITQEVLSYATHAEGTTALPVEFVVRAMFNPNLQSTWFNSVMAVINHITMLVIILTGAALIREREHGTIEHLLVMPVKPAEIMISKILANGFVVVLAAALSLWLVVQGVLRVRIAGSMTLFIAGTVLYQISVGALGILLATCTNSMGQFGMLVLPVVLVLSMLSGSLTPMESMPVWLQRVMQFTPTPHFVSFAQAVLYRGAGFAIVWPDLAALAGITIVPFVISLRRFRAAMLTFQ